MVAPPRKHESCCILENRPDAVNMDCTKRGQSLKYCIELPKKATDIVFFLWLLAVSFSLRGDVRNRAKDATVEVVKSRIPQEYQKELLLLLLEEEGGDRGIMLDIFLE